MYFSIASMAVLISEDLGFTDLQLSILFSLPTFSFIVAAWFPGLIVDKIGVRVTIPATFLLIWLASFFKIYSNSFELFVILTIFQSIGILLAGPSTSKTVKQLDTTESGKILSIINAGMMIGAWTTHTFSLRLVVLLGSWQNVTLFYLCITAILGVISLGLMFKTETKLEKIVYINEPEIMSSNFLSLFVGTKRYKMILIALSTIFFGMFSVSFALSNWFPRLLTDGGFSLKIAAQAASFLTFGSVFTSIFITFALPGLLNNYVFPVYVAGLGAILLISFIFIKQVWIILLISIIIGAIIGVTQLIVQYQIVLNSTASNVGKYSSFILFVADIGATIAIYGIGVIPETMFAAKILFVASFFMVSLVGGIILKIQSKTTI